jgi:8-oxo-dGTP diphosphatase
MKYDTQTPFVASYVILRNDKNEVAFVLRQHTGWMDGYYGLPSGKVEEGESFSFGAIREAKEEVGVTVASDDVKHATTVHRHSLEDDGSTMDWVDVYFDIIDYSGEVVNAEPDVHGEVAWFALDKLPENVIPSVAASLSAYQNGQTFLEYGW